MRHLPKKKNAQSGNSRGGGPQETLDSEIGEVEPNIRRPPPAPLFFLAAWFKRLCGEQKRAPCPRHLCQHPGPRKTRRTGGYVGTRVPFVFLDTMFHFHGRLNDADVPPPPAPPPLLFYFFFSPHANDLTKCLSVAPLLSAYEFGSPSASSLIAA